MSEQKSMSKLCLTGFILVILSPVLLVLVDTVFAKFLNSTDLQTSGVWAVLPVVGLVISIIGTATAGRNRRSGRGFGIDGIVLASICVCFVAVIALIVGAVESQVSLVSLESQMYGC